MWLNLLVCPFDSRAAPKEQKIPYVRLERLKISALEVGELPVFKLQPQDKEQEGNFLLVIECGTRSSSMSIKVSGISLRFYLPSPLYPTGLQAQCLEYCTVKKSADLFDTQGPLWWVVVKTIQLWAWCGAPCIFHFWEFCSVFIYWGTNWLTCLVTNAG